MKALRVTAPTVLELVDVPVPRLGPQDVLLRVAAAGVCHSDVHVVAMTDLPLSLPLTLGHETAGTVEAVGASVTDWAEGHAAVVHLCWSCGVCRACVAGEDNVCEASGRVAQPPCPGLGPDGGMAEFMRVPARYLVPIGALDPLTAAPLADAAMTPMHAIKGCLDRLRPGGTALVIGVGGLGHVGIQLLRALTAVRIIAVDVNAEKLDAAKRHGAEIGLLADDTAMAAVLDATGGRGADAVFDFVGTDETAALAVGTVAPNGAYRMIGIFGGRPDITASPATGAGWPWGASLRMSYGGTRSDLMDCVALARAGRITVDVERFALEDGLVAFDRLAAGAVNGRAVLVP